MISWLGGAQRSNHPLCFRALNQCMNELLRYAIKSWHGILEDDKVPKNIYDNSRSPPPPQPGDIDMITAGFPWRMFILLILPSDTQVETVS